MELITREKAHAFSLLVPIHYWVKWGVSGTGVTKKGVIFD